MIMLQARINRSPIEEASALGAVLMSGLALKHWHSLAELTALRTNDDDILPRMSGEEMKTLYTGWEKAVRLALVN